MTNSIGESAEKTPVIHIIHEVHNNSVISKVIVDKTKIQTLGKLKCKNMKNQKVQQNIADGCKTNMNSPSAPDLDILDESGVKEYFTSEMRSNSAENRLHFGGQLLRKRMAKELRYKQNFREMQEESYASAFSSTDTSVFEDEHVLDNFLQINRNTFDVKPIFKPNKHVQTEMTKNRRNMFSIGKSKFIPCICCCIV